MFPRTRHIMSQMNPIYTLSPNFLKIQYNIIFHLLLALPSGLFHSGFPTKILFAFSNFSPICYIRSPSEINYKRSVEFFFLLSRCQFHTEEQYKAIPFIRMVSRPLCCTRGNWLKAHPNLPLGDGAI